jgi:hypothetical protein
MDQSKVNLLYEDINRTSTRVSEQSKRAGQDTQTSERSEDTNSGRFP